MKAYKTFASEKRTFKDRITGANITQLTGYLGHSFHTYFTNNGWYDGNRRLLFTSDRDNATNLFSIQVESGEISQLTDFEPGSRPTVRFTNDVNPKRPEVYYAIGREMRAVNLKTHEDRLLFKVPDGFNAKGGNVGADGTVYVRGADGRSVRPHLYGSESQLYRHEGDIFDKARVLCMHDGSFFYGNHHPHPCFTADGTQILYNSNVSGYCNLYLVDVPEDVTALPFVE